MAIEKEYRAVVKFDDQGRVESVRWGEGAGPVGPALTPNTCPMRPDDNDPVICPPKKGLDLRFNELDAPEIGLELESIGAEPDAAG
jgi:hypothetical protein